MHKTIVVNTSFLALNNLKLGRWKMFTLKKNHTIILTPKTRKRKQGIIFQYVLMFMARLYIELILEVVETLE